MAAQTLEDAQRLESEAHAAYQRGDLATAEQRFRDALTIRERLAPDSLEVAASQASLGAIFIARSERGAAIELLTRALRIFERLAPDSLDLASCLSSLGAAARASGNLDAAEAHHRRSLALRERLAPDSLDVAGSLNSLGIVLFERGDLASAGQCFERSLSIRERLAPNSAAVGASLGNLGLVAHAKGDLDAAVGYLRRSLAIQEQLAPDSLAVATSLNNLGGLEQARGDLDSAADLFRRALALRERLAPGSLAEATSLGNLGSLEQQRGNLAAASDYYHRALAIAERLAPDSLTLATTLNNLGWLAHERGELDAAGDWYQRSLAIRERLAPGSLAVAGSYSNLGRLLHDRGELGHAVGLLRRSLAVKERLAPGSPDLATSLMNLGGVEFDRGDLDAATMHFEQALAINERLAPNSLAAAAALHLLAVARFALGEIDPAAELQRRALAIRERLVPDSLDLAASLNSLAGIERERGNLDAAADCLQRSLALHRRLAPGSLAVAVSLCNLGAVERERGQPVTAQQLLAEALGLCDRLAPDGLYTAQCLHSLGETALAQHDAATAVQLATRAVDIVEQQRAWVAGSEARALLTERHGDAYATLLAANLLTGDPAAALATLERSRARSLLDSLHERDLDFAADAPPELLTRQRELDRQSAAAHRELGRLDPRDDSGRIEELGVTIRQLGVQQRELASEVRRASPRFAALQDPEPLGAAGVQAALDPGTLLLAYSLGEDAAYLFSVTRESIAVHRLEAHGDALAQQVRALVAAVASPRGAAETPGRALYDLLLRPAQQAIDQADRLLFTPDDVLHTLPFAALVSSPAGRPVRYLVEDKPLHQVVSMTVYDQLRQAASPGSGRLVTFGDPLLPELLRAPPPELLTAQVRSFADLAPLPFAAEEAREVGTLFGDRAMSLVGGEASERAAKTQLGDAEVIHFACHGISLDDHPLDSSLVLAAGGGEDGLLQAWEIFEEVRLKADLVVLSACESGAGQVQRHEGLIGLTRAFHYAGARSVIASLWRVADETTCDLMTTLHRRRQAGATKDEALCAAQLELLAAGRAGRAIAGYPLSHPYFWAPFVLAGDWR